MTVGKKWNSIIRVDHFAIWCDDIEAMCTFYTTHFDCVSNSRYHNPSKNYTSYFLSFGGGDCRIELMNCPDIVNEPAKRGFMKGIAHFDIEVGNEEMVDSLTEQLRTDGVLLFEITA